MSTRFNWKVTFILMCVMLRHEKCLHRKKMTTQRPKEETRLRMRCTRICHSFNIECTEKGKLIDRWKGKITKGALIKWRGVSVIHVCLDIGRLVYPWGQWPPQGLPLIKVTSVSWRLEKRKLTATTPTHLGYIVLSLCWRDTLHSGDSICPVWRVNCVFSLSTTRFKRIILFDLQFILFHLSRGNDLQVDSVCPRVCVCVWLTID